MLGGNAEFLAKAQMKKMSFTNELISEATGFAETDDEEILNARKTFIELEAKYKEEIKEEADKVREAGGLFILGTERHDARRIDNQLRGRSGRQGDPGASQFYLSLEDDLMRLFGGEKMQGIMSKITDDEDMDITSKLITRTIESAQKKVEGKNFGIRKNTLQYDDVMNRQRELIYTQRDQVLDGIDLSETIIKMIEQNIQDTVTNYLSGDKKEDWNVDGLREKFIDWLIATEEDFTDLDSLNVTDVVEELQGRARKRLADKEEILGNEMFQDFERMVLLRNVDTYWMDHIDAMEELKKGIHLRAYAQRDPVVAYREESYDMFNEMTDAIREDTAKMMLTLMPRHKADVQRKAVAKITATSSGGDEDAKQVTIRKEKKVGPNDPCPCGSGLKYKKCCGNPAKLAQKED
jgi:preprotein translocase subunit SecA